MTEQGQRIIWRPECSVCGCMMSTKMGTECVKAGCEGIVENVVYVPLTEMARVQKLYRQTLAERDRAIKNLHTAEERVGELESRLGMHVEHVEQNH